MDISSLTTARSNLMTALATESANPKPSYSIGNRSVSWDDWRSKMIDDIDKLSELIVKLDPFFIVTRQSL